MSLVLWQKDVNFPIHVLFPLHQPLLLVFGMALKIFGKLGSHTDAVQHTARTEQFAYVQTHKTLLVSILFSWFPGYYSLKGGILPWETWGLCGVRGLTSSTQASNKTKLHIQTALIFGGKKIQSQIWALQFQTLGQLKTMVVFALWLTLGVWVDDCLTVTEEQSKARGRTPNLILAFHSQIAKSCSEAQLSWYKGTSGLWLLPQLQTPLCIALDQ